MLLSPSPPPPPLGCSSQGLRPSAFLPVSSLCLLVAPRLLAVVPARLPPPPPPGLCFAGLVPLLLFFPRPLPACLLLLLAVCGQLPLPEVPPPPGLGFVGVVALLLIFAFSHSALWLLCAPQPSPGSSGFLSLPPPLLVCLARLLPPRCSFFLLRSLLVFLVLLFVPRLSWLLAVAPSPPPSPPGSCFAGVAALRFVFPISCSAPLLLRACVPCVSAWFAPPPPAFVSRLSSSRFLLLPPHPWPVCRAVWYCRAVPWGLVVCGAACCFVWSVVRSTVPCRAVCLCPLCVVWSCAVFPPLAAPCCVSHRVAWRCAASLGAAPFAALRCLVGLCCV